VVESLPSKCKVLSSTPTKEGREEGRKEGRKEEKKEKAADICICP
jgi:hypothetical protein